MPKFRFNTRTAALLAVCFALWGCPATPPGTGGSTSADDDPDAGGNSFLGQPTPKPSTSPTPKPSPTPTPSATPTPSPTPTPPPAGPTPTPRPRLESIQVQNRISQMWLLEETPTASPPVSIPSTYSFRAEVVTRLGVVLSTSSSVVWSSSNPAILSIDPTTGYASTSVAQGLFLVTIRAATSNPLAANTIQPDSVLITVGNSGTLDVTIE